jgi:hypothetical protein
MQGGFYGTRRNRHIASTSSRVFSFNPAIFYKENANGALVKKINMVKLFWNLYNQFLQKVKYVVFFSHFSIIN